MEPLQLTLNGCPLVALWSTYTPHGFTLMEHVGKFEHV